MAMREFLSQFNVSVTSTAWSRCSMMQQFVKHGTKIKFIGQRILRIQLHDYVVGICLSRT